MKPIKPLAWRLRPLVREGASCSQAYVDATKLRVAKYFDRERGVNVFVTCAPKLPALTFAQWDALRADAAIHGVELPSSFLWNAEGVHWHPSRTSREASDA